MLRTGVLRDHAPGSNETDEDDPKTRWKFVEDIVVLQMVQRVGNQWPLIASLLPGRTSDSVRNRWHRKCKSLLPAYDAPMRSSVPVGTRPPTVVDSPLGTTPVVCMPQQPGASPPFEKCSQIPKRSKWTPTEDKLILEGLPGQAAAAPSMALMGVVSMPLGTGVSMPVGGSVPVGVSAPMRSSVPVGTRPPTVVDSPLGTTPVVCMPQQPGASPPFEKCSQIPKRSKWTPTEDKLILEGVETFGFQWRQVAALLPGRSDSSIRNRHKRLDSMRNRHTTSSDLADEGQLNSHCNFSHIMSDDQGQCPMIMDRIFLTVKATADASHSTTDLPIVDASAAYAQRSPAMPPVALPAPLVNAEAAQVQLGIPVCAFTYRVSAK